MSPNSNDGQSLASQNVNMYRYIRRKEGFRPRSDSYNGSEEESERGNDLMSEAPAVNRKKQINLNIKNKLPSRVPTHDFLELDNLRMFKKPSKNYWSPKGG